MGIDIIEGKPAPGPKEAKLYYLNDSADWVEVGDALGAPVNIDYLLVHNGELYGISFSGGRD